MKRNASPVIVVFLAVISLTCISIGTSYSYLSKLSVSTTTQNITTGNLNATLSYTQITNAQVMPLSDEEGINQTTYAKVAISKTNKYTVFYTLNIGYSTDSLASYNFTEEDLLPMEFIRIAIFDSASSTTPIAGPVSIAELPLLSVNTSDHYKDVYLLSFANFAAGSASKTYYIKAWLNPETPNELDGKAVLLDVNIEQVPLVGKSLYNLKGTVKVDGTAVSGATLSIQNNTIKGTTSSGAFTLSNVPVGTYNLGITYNNNTYETTVHLQSGASASVVARAATTCSANEPLQNCAYTYYTTVNKLMKTNSLTSYSTVAPTSSYNVPASYVITGGESLAILDITGINININSSTGAVTLSK